MTKSYFAFSFKVSAHPLGSRLGWITSHESFIQFSFFLHEHIQHDRRSDCADYLLKFLIDWMTSQICGQSHQEWSGQCVSYLPGDCPGTALQLAWLPLESLLSLSKPYSGFPKLSSPAGRTRCGQTLHSVTPTLTHPALLLHQEHWHPGYKINNSTKLPSQFIFCSMALFLYIIILFVHC